MNKLLFLSFLSLAACGGTTTPAPGETAPDAAPSASGDSASGDGGMPLTLQAWNGPEGRVSAVVTFPEPGVGSELTCIAPQSAGTCTLTSCKLGPVGDPSGGYDDFGTIYASIGTTTVPVPYSGFGYPVVDFPAPVSLAEGDTMAFRGGDGASVPTFAVSAIIPGLPALTSPVPPSGGGDAVIDTSTDFTVTWAPFSIGQMNFVLSGGSAQTDVTLSCTFNGTAGSGTVPQALLASMKGQPGLGATLASATTQLSVTTVAGGLTITTQSFQSTADDRGIAVSLE
jgi:hypothetical protein